MSGRGGIGATARIDSTGSPTAVYGMTQGSFFQSMAEARRARGKGPRPDVKPAWETKDEDKVPADLVKEVRKEIDGMANRADGVDEHVWY